MDRIEDDGLKVGLVCQRCGQVVFRMEFDREVWMEERRSRVKVICAGCSGYVGTFEDGREQEDGD